MTLLRISSAASSRWRAPLSQAVLPLSCCALSLGFALLWGTAPAVAQGRLDAQYSVKLVGIPVAKGSLHVVVHDDQFVVKADGGTSKLLKLFTTGEGSGTSQGRVVNGALVPADYRSSLTTSKKTEEVHIALTNGSVKEVTILPTPSPDPNRTPVTDAHRRDVHDPMTGAAVLVPGTGDVLTPEACHTTSAVFDGRMRFDLKFEFKRMEQVRADKGYRGPVVVCSVYFVPIAGYIPDRPTIKYLSAQRNIEIALAPIAGTRILAPFWMRGPTPLGTATMEATTFMTQGEATPAPKPK